MIVSFSLKFLKTQGTTERTLLDVFPATPGSTYIYVKKMFYRSLPVSTSQVEIQHKAYIDLYSSTSVRGHCLDFISTDMVTVKHISQAFFPSLYSTSDPQILIVTYIMITLIFILNGTS